MIGVDIKLPDLSAFKDRIAEMRMLVLRKAVLQLWSELVATTPVDTGRARAGWSVRIDGPGSNVPPQGVNAFPVQPDVSNIDDVAFIYNNVEYIRRLNDGHSQQAPAMFVEAAIQRVTS